MLNFLQNFLSINKIVLTEEFSQFFDSMEKTSNNFFLTGKAGTGKSTLVQYFREKTKKKVAVLAPTGLAAINVRGQTIHSFFRFPPQMITSEVIAKSHSDSRLYRQIDTLVIDEVSMVRADMLDGIDMFLRKFGRDRNMPFGGVQIILVGDLFQLPPILTEEEKTVFNRFYDSPYFISSDSFFEGKFSLLELTKIFRQTDQEFIKLLNQVRTGNISHETLKPINGRLKDSKSIDRTKAVTLTTTNRVAQEINLSQLSKLPDEEFVYGATFDGDFPTKEFSLPVELELRLKIGARVMFVKNGELYVNGTLGVIKRLTEHKVVVKIDDTLEEIEVEKTKWDNIKYSFDEETKTIVPKVAGTMSQYPIRLAWAITIHKSQGMTFSKINIDYSRSPFAHGQTYVALSRCRSLKGISISKEIYPNDVIVDQRVVEYLKN